MLLAVEEHAPQARCDACGSPKIVSVCHHCGIWLCHKHGRRATDAAGRPVSKEFEGLWFDGRQAGLYHCAEHDHAVKGGLLIVVLIGACVAVAGAFVLLTNIPAGLAMLVAGVGVAIGFLLGHRRRLAEARKVRPPLPVMPNLDLVSVRETIRGDVVLADDGTYTSVARPAEGTLAVVMTLTGQDRALSAYRAKYGLTAHDPVEFSAGFAVLDGEVGLTFSGGHEQENRLYPGSTGLTFGGVVSGHPLFNTGRGRSSGQWTVRLPYRLQQVRTPRSIPLWIIPSLVPGSDRRTLQVELEWGRFGAQRPKDIRRNLKFLQFEAIEFDVPAAAWGNVESVEPASNSVIGKSGDASTQTIRWRLLSPTRQDGAERTILRIRFEKPIGKMHTLTGRLRASFMGTLAGITDIRMYWPTGGSWPQQPEASIAMEAQVRFELSLNSVRYQAVRVVPDGDADSVRLPRVIPDHRTVIALTNKLTTWGYYVKRVTGHPPRGGGHADLTNRVWDIAGRKYEGVFPVDFHITLMGEEAHRCGGIHSTAGNTVARLAVRGSYVDEPMERAVVTAWDELHEKLITELKTRETFAPGDDGDPPPVGEWMPRPAGPLPPP